MASSNTHGHVFGCRCTECLAVPADRDGGGMSESFLLKTAPFVKKLKVNAEENISADDIRNEVKILMSLRKADPIGRYHSLLIMTDPQREVPDEFGQCRIYLTPSEPFLYWKERCNPSVMLLLHLGRELLICVKWLHEVGRIVHKDIKPDNVLVRGQHVIVCDYGLSVIMHKHSQTAPKSIAGTAMYAAPETQLAGGSKTIGPAVDVFGAGCCILEMVSTQPIDNDEQQWNSFLANQHIYTSLPVIHLHKRLVPKLLWLLVKDMTRFESKNRPSIQQVLKSELFNPSAASSSETDGESSVDENAASNVNRGKNRAAKGKVSHVAANRKQAAVALDQYDDDDYDSDQSSSQQPANPKLPVTTNKKASRKLEKKNPVRRAKAISRNTDVPAKTQPEMKKTPRKLAGEKRTENRRRELGLLDKFQFDSITNENKVKCLSCGVYLTCKNSLLSDHKSVCK